MEKIELAIRIGIIGVVIFFAIQNILKLQGVVNAYNDGGNSPIFWVSVIMIIIITVVGTIKLSK